MFCPQKFNQNTLLPNGHVIYETDASMKGANAGCQCEKELCAWYLNDLKCCAMLVMACKK